MKTFIEIQTKYRKGLITYPEAIELLVNKAKEEYAFVAETLKEEHWQNKFNNIDANLHANIRAL